MSILRIVIIFATVMNNELSAIDWPAVWIALTLTAAAGLSTLIGAFMAMSKISANTRLTAAALGLSAGVMVYISLVELVPEATEELHESFRHPEAIVLIAFFGAALLMALIDKLLNRKVHTHSTVTAQTHSHQACNSGCMLALAISIHNFPEGMATFVSALDGVAIAIPILVAIVLHNIPMGIAVTTPVYAVTQNRSKAIRYATLVALSAPAGALLGGLFLLPFWDGPLQAVCLTVTAGIMVYISFDELLPSAFNFGHHHIALGGLFTGMAIIAVSMAILHG